MLGRFLDERIQLADHVGGSARESFGKLAIDLAALVAALFLANRPVRFERAVDGRPPDLPLIQNLQRGFAAAMPLIEFHVARPRLLRSSAISIAASAASRPLLAAPGAARSSASSTELVVRTPNAIGTAVASAALVIPCATADAMYSK